MAKTRGTSDSRTAGPIDARAVVARAFRSGSSAQKVAERLLDGRPHARQELAESVGVSESTVPRVVSVLRREGVPVDATIGPDGRSSVFQVGAPENSTTPGSGTAVEVVAHGRRYAFTIHEDGSVTVRTPRSEVTIV